MKSADDYSSAFIPGKIRRSVAKFVFEKDRKRVLGGKLLLDYVCREKYGINDCLHNLQYNDYGKPFIESGPKFNISHSGDYVVLAVSELDVGIDIEEIQNVETKDYYSQLSENEIKKIESSPNTSKEFFNMWTKKESLIKAAGIGLSADMKEIDISEACDTSLNNTHLIISKIHFAENYAIHIAHQDKVESEPIYVDISPYLR